MLKVARSRTILIHLGFDPMNSMKTHELNWIVLLDCKLT